MCLNVKIVKIILIAMAVVAIARVEASRIAYLGLDSEGAWQVWIMDIDNMHTERVTETPGDKVSVSWYPDNESVFMNSIDGHAYRVDIQTGKQVRIDTSLSGFQDAVLAPNGKHFIFSLSTSGSVDDNNIWRARADGTALEKVTSLPWLQHEPTWGPESEVIYFLSGSGGQNHDIWQIDLASREPRQVTANQVYHFDVAVAPDNTLAYSNNRDGNYDIWLRAPDGAERRLTEHPGLDARPSWSPDGRYLVFESTRDGGPDIWLLDLDSDELTRLTNTGGGARFPVWQSREVAP